MANLESSEPLEKAIAGPPQNKLYELKVIRLHICSLDFVHLLAGNMKCISKFNFMKYL